MAGRLLEGAAVVPRPSRPWFRVYVEMIHDRKIRRLEPAHRWLWVTCLAAARASCIPGWLLVSEREPMTEDDLADLAALPVAVVRKGVAAFVGSGMLALDPNLSAWMVTKWDKRQFETDNTTERTRKHRSKEEGRNVPTSPVGTGLSDQSQSPESETELSIIVSPTGGDGAVFDDDDLSQVWEAVADLRTAGAAAAGQISKSRDGYRRSVLANLPEGDMADRARALLARFNFSGEAAPARVLAEVLEGKRDSRHLVRRGVAS